MRHDLFQQLTAQMKHFPVKKEKEREQVANKAHQKEKNNNFWKEMQNFACSYATILNYTKMPLFAESGIWQAENWPNMWPSDRITDDIYHWKCRLLWRKETSESWEDPPENSYQFSTLLHFLSSNHYKKLNCEASARAKLKMRHTYSE